MDTCKLEDGLKISLKSCPSTILKMDLEIESKAISRKILI